MASQLNFAEYINAQNGAMELTRFHDCRTFIYSAFFTLRRLSCFVSTAGVTPFCPLSDSAPLSDRILLRFRSIRCFFLPKSQQIFGLQVFHKVAAAVDGKTVPDVIEFYYMWKKTNHYKQWKATWRAEQAILQPSDSESEGEDDDGDESYEQNTGGSSASSVVDVERAEVGGVGSARGRKNGGGGRSSS